ncbi:MAG: hypothetical protein RLZZ511_2391 [Cyanobacteriota bacterium]|jgi:hypothetical protein
MSDATTVLNNPYVDELRLQRDDILARLLGISQLEYENDLYTHHDGSVWTYFGEMDGKQSTEESARFWVWVETGLQSEIIHNGLVFDHSLNPLTGIPIEMGDERDDEDEEEIDASSNQKPRYDRAMGDLPDYVWTIATRRHWEVEAINAANDASYGSESAIAQYREAQSHMPGKRPKPLSPEDFW